MYFSSNDLFTKVQKSGKWGKSESTNNEGETKVKEGGEATKILSTPCEGD